MDRDRQRGPLPGGAWIDPLAFVASDAIVNAGAWIGPDVNIGPGAVVSPGAVLGLAGPQCPPGPVEIGPGTWVGPHVHVEPGVQIGKDGVIGSSTLIRSGARIGPAAEIGPRCTIMDNARIEEGAHLIADVYVCEYARLGPQCWISPGVSLVNDRYPPTALEIAGPVVGQCAVIGVHSIIWPGVKLGYHAMVASLSEVKEDVADYVLVRGCPARPVCDVRQIRMKLKDKWVYPYPWMRINMPEEDITQPIVDFRKKRNGNDR